MSGVWIKRLRSRRELNWLSRTFGEQCAYCGSPDSLTWDHLVPRSKGGSHSTSNLVRACAKCNINKGSKSLEEWLAKRPDLDGAAITSRIKKAQKEFFRRVGFRKLQRTLTIKLGELIENGSL